MKKRLVSLILAAVLACTLIPVLSILASADVINVTRAYEVQNWINWTPENGEITINLKTEASSEFPTEFVWDQCVTITKPCTVHFVTYSPEMSINAREYKDRLIMIEADNVTLTFDSNVHMDHFTVAKQLWANGCGIYVDGKNCRISGGYFQGFYAKISNEELDPRWQKTRKCYGGAIYVNKPGCIIENCTFKNCIAKDAGGAICIDHNDCKVINCRFDQCNAGNGQYGFSGWGGAIYICELCKNNDIIKCSFGDGYAREHGDWVYGHKNTRIMDCNEMPENPTTSDAKYYNIGVDCFISKKDTIKEYPEVYQVFPEEGDYVITTALDESKCLDISGGVDAVDGGKHRKLQLWNVSSSKAMVYTLSKGPDEGTYFITPKQSVTAENPNGLVLTIGSDERGNAILYQDKKFENDSVSRQMWTFLDGGNGYLMLHSEYNNYSTGYMDVFDSYTGNGATVGCSDINGKQNQLFKLTNTKTLSPYEPEEGTYVIHPAGNTNLCLDVAGGTEATANGCNVQTWETETSGAKYFIFEKDSATNSYIIHAPVNHDLVLDISGASTASGANVQQWEDLGKNTQRWVFGKNYFGDLYIKSLCGTYLEVNGTNIQVGNFSANINQQFILEPVTESEEGNENPSTPSHIKPLEPATEENASTGSVFSQGSVWIILAVAVVVLGGVAALVIVKKKKKPVVADGTDYTDEE